MSGLGILGYRAHIRLLGDMALDLGFAFEIVVTVFWVLGLGM